MNVAYVCFFMFYMFRNLVYRLTQPLYERGLTYSIIDISDLLQTLIDCFLWKDLIISVSILACLSVRRRPSAQRPNEGSNKIACSNLQTYLCILIGGWQ